MTHPTPDVAVISVNPIPIINAAGPIVRSGTYPTWLIDFASSGVTPGTYGDASHIPSVTVDTYGRVTSASSSALPTAVTVVPDANNDVNVTTVGTVNTLSVGQKQSSVAGTCYILNATTPDLSNTNTGRTAYGFQAGNVTQATNTTAIGNQAGSAGQGDQAVSVGAFAGNSNQGTVAVAIGYNAAQNSQGPRAIAIGSTAGRTSQGMFAIAIGHNAGSTTQSSGAIAIGGNGAAQNSQGPNAIAIGLQCASVGTQLNSSIAFGGNCAVPGAAGRLAFGNSMEAIATTATAGANGALPVTVAGYIKLEWNGTLCKIPFYAN